MKHSKANKFTLILQTLLFIDYCTTLELIILPALSTTTSIIEPEVSLTFFK